MVILAWLTLRGVIPVPESGRIPIAIILLGLGFATWWPTSTGPSARGKSLRPFGLADFVPIACMLTGGLLLLAGLLGLGARPLELAADQVSDLVWGDPDAEKENKEKAKPDEQAAPAQEGDTLSSWQNRSLPLSGDGDSRPDAPPLLLTFQRAEDMALWKSRVVYVRVAALEVAGAHGGSWKPLAVQPEVLDDAADGLSDGLITNPESATGAGIPAAWSILITQDTTTVPSLVGMEKLRAGSVRRQGSAIWSLDAPAGSFAGTSRPLVAGNDIKLLPEKPLFPTRPANDPLLALPADRVGDLVRSMAGDFDRNLPFRDLVASVPVWLARRCAYSDVYSNPNTLPPLVNFLDVSRAGICEHFAAAGVLLFRALGIPSRIAYGYAGGTLAESSRMITYGAKDFHAWAEILVPGTGWVAVECTPAGSGAARPPEPSGENAPDTPTTPDESPQDAAPDWKRWASMTGIGLGLFFAAWLTARLRSRGRGRERNPEDATFLPQPAWFQAFLNASARLGAPRRRGRTAREHLDFLRRARIADSGIEELIEEYHRIRYDGRADDRSAEMEAIVARWLDHHHTMIHEKQSQTRPTSAVRRADDGF